MSEVVTSSRRTSWFINRNFTLLWFGQSISSIGDFFFTTTLALWVATQLAKGQTWAPLAVSGVAIASVIPLLLIGPIAGVFVDRWDKRQTMLRMDALRAILVALLLFLIILISSPYIVKNHSINAWLLVSIYIIVALVSVCSQFFNPSRFALIGDIVPEAQRTHASSFTSISFNLSLIIGPSLAAPLYFAFSMEWAIAINALSFVVSFLAIMTVHTPKVVQGSKPRQNRKLITNFIAGFALFFLLGFANAGINVVVGPLMLKATPREFVGRVQSVNTPLIIGSSLVSTALAGFLASTVLNKFHASLLGSSFGSLDTIFSLSGFIVMGAGIYVLLALKESDTKQHEKAENAQDV